MAGLLINLLNEVEDYPESSLFPYYDFGLGVRPHLICEPKTNLARVLNRLNDRQLSRSERTTVSNIGKDGFQVCMDVAQFKPSELSVKVVDNSVVVEGKHEERQDDHGYISRHFVRRYAVPKDYDSDKVMSTLSSDGVLSISIPKPKSEEKSNERVIQIQQTGPAHLNVKENVEGKKNQETKEVDGAKKK